MSNATYLEVPVGACTSDPERWTTRADAEAKAICRGCPRRWMCARDAVELPRAEGFVGRNRHPGGRPWPHLRAQATSFAGRAQRLPCPGDSPGVSRVRRDAGIPKLVRPLHHATVPGMPRVPLQNCRFSDHSPRGAMAAPSSTSHWLSSAASSAATAAATVIGQVVDDAFTRTDRAINGQQRRRLGTPD